MTDPLKLAEEIEPSAEPGAYCADKSHRHVTLTVTEADARLLAAAIRLAEAEVAWHTGSDVTPDHALAVQLFDARHAYRRAKEEA